MKIEVAKICLSILVEVKHRMGKDYEAKALQLGLEALTFIERMRINYPQFPYTPLPSETPEEE